MALITIVLWGTLYVSLFGWLSRKGVNIKSIFRLNLSEYYVEIIILVQLLASFLYLLKY